MLCEGQGTVPGEHSETMKMAFEGEYAGPRQRQNTFRGKCHSLCDGSVVVSFGAEASQDVKLPTHRSEVMVVNGLGFKSLKATNEIVWRSER